MKPEITELHAQAHWVRIQADKAAKVAEGITDAGGLFPPTQDRQYAARGQLRAGLPPVPRIMRDLPIDRRGYPVPWFVHQDPDTAEFDFRVIGSGKIIKAIRENRCWVSGKVMEHHALHEYAFMGGPMSSLSGTFAEPPMMIEAAEYAAKTCPFLVIPTAKRREAGLEGKAKELPGIHIPDNPGVTAITTCFRFKVVQAGDGVLFRVPHPSRIRWFSEGRELTMDEMLDPGGTLAKALHEGMAKALAISPKAGDDIQARYERVMELSTEWDGDKAKRLQEFMGAYKNGIVLQGPLS